MENKKMYSFGKPNVFGFPQGFLGVLTGWLMGRLSVELNTWAVRHLDVQPTDHVLVNNVMLWPNPEASLNDVRRVLKTGGRIVITLCPRWAKTFQDVEDMGHEILDLVNQVGFVDTTLDLRRDLRPAGALTVVARK